MIEETDGTYTVNGLTAEWSAKLVEEKREGKTLAGSLGYYRFGLYDVKAEVYRVGEGLQLDTFYTRLVGFEGVRLPSVEVGKRDE